MKQLLIIVLLINVHPSGLIAQVKGCTDKQASNYNSSAEINDGSCSYNTSSYSPIEVCPKFSDTIMESSGLILYSKLFWTLNDSDNPPILYAFDSTKGYILHQTVIGNGVNIDWEELTQDSLYIYIGDFGNNKGSRKDLKIYKIRKSRINLDKFTDTVQAEIIRFEMQDQSNFNNTGQNHDYDMEACISIGDSLHLFSKNWVDRKCRHYVCPKDTGFFSLIPVETLETDGQVTGACIAWDGSVCLTGYNKGNYGSFIYLCWDYRNNRFLSGNRRRISIGNMISPGQNEAVCFKGNSVYMSNEKQFSAAGLNRIEILQWTGGNKHSSSIQDKGKKENIHIQVINRQIKINLTNESTIKTLSFYDTSGKCIYTLEINAKNESIDISSWATGVYMVYSGKQLLKKILID